MSNSTDVAIVGAGPYGLSIAAHLQERGIRYRVIGRPMQFWISQMPDGMQLKSEGFASNLYDPQGGFTLRDFCARHAIPYADIGTPVDKQTFCAYGLAFQKRFVPKVDSEVVVALDRCSTGFQLQLEDGESFSARKVVLAVGIGHFSHIPPLLANLPEKYLSHSSHHGELEHFRGRDVTVIGGGASAIDLAALLFERGAQVRLVARRATLDIHTKLPWPRPLWRRIRCPMSGIGPSWRSLFLTEAPLLVHQFPEARRLRIVKDYLGPAGGWFMRDRLIGRVPLLTGRHLDRVSISHDGVHLRFAASDSSITEVTTDHVIAATGYRVDLDNLKFLSDDVRNLVKKVERTPVLSSYFESSLPGLYLVGPVAANSFGPVMRFAVGAGFTARRITKHLTATLVQPVMRARTGVVPGESQKFPKAGCSPFGPSLGSAGADERRGARGVSSGVSRPSKPI
jgi:thioredoxin reductase